MIGQDFDDEDLLVSPDKADVNLAVIARQAETALALSKEIEEIEAYLGAKRDNLRMLLEKTLPETMKLAGMSSFTLDNGVSLKVSDFVAGSLPKEPELRASALDWIERNGGQDLIKNTITVALGRGDNRVPAIVEALENLGVEYSHKPDVHHSTLAAFGRELLAAGKEVPLAQLGLYAGCAAKIIAPKGKKG